MSQFIYYLFVLLDLIISNKLELLKKSTKINTNKHIKNVYKKRGVTYEKC